MKKSKLYLLDIMPLLYRAHFATLDKRFVTSTGIDTRTSLVFFNYIFQVLTEEKPSAIAAALDSRPEQRMNISAVYKANREMAAGEISDAFPYVMRLLEALRIPVFRKKGYEADDLIATIARKAARQGYTVYIVSPDKDFAQLVNRNILLFRPAFKRAVLETLDTEGVRKKFGVEPEQVADFLALKGDPVDNIPGVRGIGDKTAAALLADHGSVEELMKNLDKVKQARIRESLESSRRQLMESKRLALLDSDVEIAIDWKKMHVQHPEEEKLFSLLDELEFVRIKERVIKHGLAGKAPAALPEDRPAMLIQVNAASVKDVVKLIKNKKQAAIGYLDQAPDRLFLYPESENSIYEVKMSSEAEWKKIMAELDRSSLVITGWRLKPLLKRTESIRTRSNKLWIDLQLAAYLLEPDAKNDWLLVQNKYNLPRYELVPPYQDLGHLPALGAAYRELTARIENMDMKHLLFHIELPLVRVLARMEVQGIKIDVEALKHIEETLGLQLASLEQQLHEIAGRKFNINSPSQTAEILKGIADTSELKKTSTGQVSTAEPFLSDLAPKYPFVDVLLRHRKLNKIITTYLHALPKYADPITHRIHPTFQQAVAGTGRLSCTDPNLQNLPIRNEAGREVRRAVIPSGPGYSILSIDYNQVELRLLASLSGDKVMTEAFRSGKDIHTITACKVFGVDEKSVTKELRNKAKGVNFGIAYGITPWGLSSRLKISQKEGKEIIDAYFEEFPAVKDYLERSIAETREKGFTRTKYGRIRYIEGINSRNGTTRKMAERMAVNAPLQGLAADIIKDAMVAVDEYIIAHNLRTRLVLQVHDELVFDADDEELEEFIPAARRIMESRGGFAVPMQVHISKGPNWLEMTDT